MLQSEHNPEYIEPSCTVRENRGILAALERERIERDTHGLTLDRNERRAAVVSCVLLVSVAAFLVGWLVNIG